MDLAEQFAGGIVEGLLLDHLERVAELLQHGKVTIDHGVEEQGAEVVGAELADPRAAVADPFANARKPIGHGAIVKRDHVAVAEEDRHRVGDDRFPIRPGHPHGDQQLVAEDLDLGPLVGGGRVFEGEVADLEDLAHRADRGEVFEAVHVEPDDRPLFPSDREFLQ